MCFLAYIDPERGLTLVTAYRQICGCGVSEQTTTLMGRIGSSLKFDPVRVAYKGSPSCDPQVFDIAVT